MIVAHNLSKSFGKLVAVDSINFRIPRGKVVGFLGPNGAGKSTTIRMIAGYLTPTQGTVEVDGLDVVSFPRETRQRIGYMPESTPLYPEMRVGEYLKYRARLFGLATFKRRRRIDSVLEMCSIRDVRRRTIGHLSKGYRQRVGLAAAILHGPPLLILDEPTSGLDPEQIREVRSLIRNLAGKHTILLSTHILPEAELVCDDIVMMAGGKILAQGSVDRLRQTLAQGSRYIIETDSADAEAALAALPSVESTHSMLLSDGWYRLTVTPSPNAEDRREVMSRTLRKLGCGVREIKREAPSLEQMFVSLVSGGRESAVHAAGDDDVAIPMSTTNAPRPKAATAGRGDAK